MKVSSVLFLRFPVQLIEQWLDRFFNVEDFGTDGQSVRWELLDNMKNSDFLVEGSNSLCAPRYGLARLWNGVCFLARVVCVMLCSGTAQKHYLTSSQEHSCLSVAVCQLGHDGLAKTKC